MRGFSGLALAILLSEVASVDRSRYSRVVVLNNFILFVDRPFLSLYVPIRTGVDEHFLVAIVCLSGGRQCGVAGGERRRL